MDNPIISCGLINKQNYVLKMSLKFIVADKAWGIHVMVWWGVEVNVGELYHVDKNVVHSEVKLKVIQETDVVWWWSRHACWMTTTVWDNDMTQQ